VEEKMNTTQKAMYILLLALLLLASRGVQAANEGQAFTIYCGPHKGLVARLKEQYGETLAAVGVGSEQNSIFELFLAPDGSWSGMLSPIPPTGQACVIVGGYEWTTFPRVEEMGDSS
jgi:hypothetical protein